MGLSTVVVLIIAIIIGLGLRTILRDWRNKFAEDDKIADARRKANLERNRQEARNADVVTLEKGEDGVYRPGGKD